METVKKIDVTTVKKTSINDLSVCILFCVLCSIVVSSASHHFHLYRSVLLYKKINSNEEALKLAQQTVDDNKVLSHTGDAIKNEIIAKPNNGIKENVRAGDGGTDDVKPFKTQPGQDNLSENETPRGLLPP
jgi:hypothetical protein